MSRSSLWFEVEAIIARHPEVGPTRKSNGQKSALNLLNRQGDWRSKLWAAAKDTPLAAPLAVSILSGCRPLELCHGITVELEQDNSVRLHTEGVKLKRNASGNIAQSKGQEWRSVWVAPDSDQSRFLARLAKRNGGSIVVRFEHAAAVDLKAVAARWGHEVRGLAQAAFPKLGDKSISPYALRHAFSAELKRQINAMEGMTEQERAEMRACALGHLSAMTPSRYGTSQQAGKGKAATIVRVAAPNPVRNISKANPRRQAARSAGPRTR